MRLKSLDQALDASCQLTSDLSSSKDHVQKAPALKICRRLNTPRLAFEEAIGGLLMGQLHGLRTNGSFARSCQDIPTEAKLLLNYTDDEEALAEEIEQSDDFTQGCH